MKMTFRGINVSIGLNVVVNMLTLESEWILMNNNKGDPSNEDIVSKCWEGYFSIFNKNTNILVNCMKKVSKSRKTMVSWEFATDAQINRRAFYSLLNVKKCKSFDFKAHCSFMARSAMESNDIPVFKIF